MNRKQQNLANKFNEAFGGTHTVWFGYPPANSVCYQERALWVQDLRSGELLSFSSYAEANDFLLEQEYSSLEQEILLREQEYTGI